MIAIDLTLSLNPPISGWEWWSPALISVFEKWFKPAYIVRLNQKQIHKIGIHQVKILAGLRETNILQVEIYGEKIHQ